MNHEFRRINASTYAIIEQYQIDRWVRELLGPDKGDGDAIQSGDVRAIKNCFGEVCVYRLEQVIKSSDLK